MRMAVMAVCAVIFSLSQAACSDAYTGRIAVKGHEPFVYLVLINENGEMKVTGPLGETLRRCCQGATVTVRGTVTARKKGFMEMTELEVTEILDPRPSGGSSR